MRPSILKLSVDRGGIEGYGLERKEDAMKRQIRV
jgi:hypothetical protein